MEKNMYELKYHKGLPRPWQIIKVETGEIVGSSVTRKNAVGSIAHRMDAMKKKGEISKSKMSSRKQLAKHQKRTNKKRSA